jgi:hypothetical protein
MNEPRHRWPHLLAHHPWSPIVLWQDQVLNRVFFLLWLGSVPSMLGAVAVFALNVELRQVGAEIRDGLYSPFSYLIANTLIQLPLLVLLAVCAILVPGYAVGNLDITAFPKMVAERRSNLVPCTRCRSDGRGFARCSPSSPSSPPSSGPSSASPRQWPSSPTLSSAFSPSSTSGSSLSCSTASSYRQTTSSVPDPTPSHPRTLAAATPSHPRTLAADTPS